MRSLCLGLASLLFASACGVANADRVAEPYAGQRIAIATAPAKVRAPYDVQILRESGDVLPTHASRDRFYVQGNAGERYVIRVSNPTANRVEAVVTVDGLDVVDGEPGDLRKRGYVVPPYGEVRIEGFRTSAADVATFRFSSVGASYAGKKGKARNVGVIAVAIFEERDAEPPQVIVEPDAPPHRFRHRLEDAPADARGGSVSSTGSAKAPARLRPAPPAPPSEAPHADSADDEASEYAPRDAGDPGPTPPVTRPGLGTEFGEQRYSAASWTRFVRAEGRPIAIAELRYNDVAGLTALGIHVEPLPDAAELMMRETADPFPGDGRFASPP